MKNTFASRAFATNFGKGKNVSSDEIESATSAFLESGGEITKLPSIGYDVEEDTKDFVNHFLTRCQGKTIERDEDYGYARK
jgi:hypothetical protein|tara:strand:- start:76 stop:318 length:243 start_codon:yes stop_codon:yes gene_type:complete